MKTYLIRPEYLDNLHSLIGKTLESKMGRKKRAYLRYICHQEPWGDIDELGDFFTLDVEGKSEKTYIGNEGYREFLKEWGVVE